MKITVERMKSKKGNDFVAVILYDGNTRKFLSFDNDICGRLSGGISYAPECSGVGILAEFELKQTI